MKLLKITINNRVEKVLNFDKPDTPNNHYIIRRGDNDEYHDLVKFANNKSLILNDGSSRELGIGAVCYDNKDNPTELIVTLNLSAQKKSKNDGTPQIPDGIELKNNVLKGKKPGNSNELKVSFKLVEDPSSEQSTRTRSIILYFATGNLYDAIIDFGSEASQAQWYKHGNLNKVNLTKSIFSALKKSKSAESVQDESQRSYKDYIQYETDDLYKSLYFIKKELNPNIHIQAWPDDCTDESMKFLVHKEDENAYNNYIQIPNAKFFSVVSREFMPLTITRDNRNIDLTQLDGRVIERVLLNNVVQQVLKSVLDSNEEKGPVYIVLNVLMPNVYPIHVITQKLDNLAEDIAKKFNDSVAVELRPISESDASFLGYINNKESNGDPLPPGNYLIADAGKGTLDLSIMNISQEQGYVNKNRSGIIGAGNAITYGVLVALVNEYLCYMYIGYVEKVQEEKHCLIRRFICDIILNNKEEDNKIKRTDLAKMVKLEKAVEAYKIKYNESWKPDLGVDENYPEVSDNAKPIIKDLSIDNFTNWINERTNSANGSLGQSIMLSAESREYITNEIDCIINETIKELRRMKKNLDGKVENVVFAGRGFLMKEFRVKMLNQLKQDDCFKQSAEGVNLDNMKSECLDINQLMINKNYDNSPSKQICYIWDPVGGNDGQGGKKKDKKVKKNKENEDPDYPPYVVMPVPYGNSGSRSFEGELEGEGIVLDNITATSRVYIGGGEFDTDREFNGKEGRIFFDGSAYYLTAEGVKPQEFGAEGILNTRKFPLLFDSLFPNVIVENAEKIRIPVKVEVIQQELNEVPKENEGGDGEDDSGPNIDEKIDEEVTGTILNNVVKKLKLKNVDKKLKQFRMGFQKKKDKHRKKEK